MGIFVWGTGCGASEFLDAGMELDRITAFVDSFPSHPFFLGKSVLKPEELDINNCDLLVITARDSNGIARRCMDLGIPADNCLYLKNNAVLADRNTAYALAKDLLGEELMNKLLPKQRIVSTPLQLSCAKLPEPDLNNDYVRLSTLELLSRRLQDVPGATAELGVYRGFFARCINQLLPDRKLYLFDSFEGFGDHTAASNAFQAAHQNTAAQQVMAIMPHPEMVSIQAGFFPDSLNGLEEQFCLVSLDVDFYQTTLDGLRYFWPRIRPGGYLLLHDWGNPKLPEVAEALAHYEAEIEHNIPAVPMCDVNGSLVLCK